MSVARFLWSPVTFVPALAAVAIIEPLGALVTALGLFALWAGLRHES